MNIFFICRFVEIDFTLFTTMENVLWEYQSIYSLCELNEEEEEEKKRQFF